MTDGLWHNITLFRRGSHATLEVTTNNTIVGSISGSEGTHQLLDSNGIIYTGGISSIVDGKDVVVDDFNGM